MKRCGHCKEEKTLFEFHKSRRERDGRQSRCKDCNKRGIVRGQERADQARGVYLAVVKTIRGDFYVKVGKTGDGTGGFGHRAGLLAASARERAVIDAEWGEVLYVIDVADADERSDLEAAVLAMAKPIIGDEYFHVSDYNAFAFVFAQQGRIYDERTTYEVRRAEFIEYLAKRDRSPYVPDERKSLPVPF